MSLDRSLLNRMPTVTSSRPVLRLYKRAAGQRTHAMRNVQAGDGDTPSRAHRSSLHPHIAPHGGSPRRAPIPPAPYHRQSARARALKQGERLSRALASASSPAARHCSSPATPRAGSSKRGGGAKR
eukprot:3645528-Prymnesium_polylepis.1